MSAKSRKIAVITGDLVSSTALGREKVERAFAALKDCAETQADWHGAPLHFTRHRGDGWQVVLARPEMALRSALAFRAALRAEGSEFDSYMGIAEGELEGDVGPDLNAETAEVFELSGEALETTKADLPQKITTSHSTIETACFVLADKLTRGWTPAQASTILPMLPPTHSPSQTDLARLHGKTHQAISKSLAAASFSEIDEALAIIELFHQ
jgi:hypothetical protein